MISSGKGYGGMSASCHTFCQQNQNLKAQSFDHSPREEKENLKERVYKLLEM